MSMSLGSRFNSATPGQRGWTAVHTPPDAGTLALQFGHAWAAWMDNTITLGRGTHIFAERKSKNGKSSV